ncbi:nitrite reductase small subunit NirD [Streptomyces sp. ME19-01-6]|uniref:nitrite reductase small subunit NirD n=1 Tax=Streptomyces sp. ME19-01-6 TaxID=3028686 RepID=UPI0029ABCED5|nr:nitrite reductase small subunit NirD [Streptomyces sp. ME19-01-6]MDX3224438.1 nitrite reductase small subunit NirD [Streptomyces sp. ME19-01-6]
MTMTLERTAVRVELLVDHGWFAVCELSDLIPGRGVAALLPDGTQVAIFLDRAGQAYAIDNRDPFTGAYVLSRGLLGSVQERPFVASPLLKQRFDLETGRCLDDEGVAVQAYAARIDDGVSAQVA